MDLQQLKTFTVIAKLGSFTKAAELLDYAQSSISAQIRSLETELETKIFERMGREIHLTEAGERLLIYAEQLLRLAEETKEAVAGTTVPKGTLTIGAPESLCVFRLPRILLHYRKHYPDVKLVLKLGSCKDLYAWLRNNTIDIAYLLDVPSFSHDLILEPLRMERMTLIAGKDHPLSGHRGTLAQNLSGEDLILIEEGACCYRKIFEQQLSSANVQLGSVQEFGSVEMIKKCVFSGLGISLLPRMAVEQEIAHEQLSDLNWDDSDFNIHLLMCSHKDKWLSPALSALMITSRAMLVQHDE